MKALGILRPSLLWLLLCAVLVDGRWWVPPFFRRAPKAVAESKKVPAGLKNLANTCYMNSVLQGIFHLNRFRTEMTICQFQDSTVGLELSRLFQDMKESVGGTVNTRQFANTLGVNVNNQEDAQEFLLRVLNDVEDSVSVAETASSASRNSNPYKSAAGSVFRGEIEQIVNCSYVNFTKYRQQKFFDLTVDISGFSKLEEALSAMFTKPEKLIGENRYRAGEHGLQDAEKRLRLAKLPKVLCVTLKRFTYDIETSAMLKIGDRLEFPVSLDVKPYTKEEEQQAINDKGYSTIYELNSVVIHEGTADFGHYFCFARPDLTNKPDEWVKLNDNLVSNVSLEDVSEASFGGKYFRVFGRGSSGDASSNAYLLFYSQKQIE